jgi:hypothetical protein
MESLDWRFYLSPGAFPGGSKSVLGEGETITVDLGVGIHHGRYVRRLPDESCALPTERD